jgi:hypothetical protein
MVGATELSDGRIAVQTVAVWTTVDDARRALGPLLDALRPTGTAWIPGGPVGALATDLKGSAFRARVGNRPPTQITGRQVAEACQEFADLIDARRIVHPGDPLLDGQIAGAKKIPNADGWRFARRGRGHVNAVYAMAGAVYELRNAPQPPRKGIVRQVIVGGADDDD